MQSGLQNKRSLHTTANFALVYDYLWSNDQVKV